MGVEIDDQEIHSKGGTMHQTPLVSHPVLCVTGIFLVTNTLILLGLSGSWGKEMDSVQCNQELRASHVE